MVLRDSIMKVLTEVLLPHNVRTLDILRISSRVVFLISLSNWVHCKLLVSCVRRLDRCVWKEKLQSST